MLAVDEPLVWVLAALVFIAMVHVGIVNGRGHHLFELVVRIDPSVHVDVIVRVGIVGPPSRVESRWVLSTTLECHFRLP